MEDPAFSLSKEKSQQAETELQAVLRELGSERVDAVKALVDPRLLKLFEASPKQVLVHVVPHKCCVPLARVRHLNFKTMKHAPWVPFFSWNRHIRSSCAKWSKKNGPHQRRL